MQQLDLQVIRQALTWSQAGQRLWLCTVLGTYGSPPPGPGRPRGGVVWGEWVGWFVLRAGGARRFV